MRRSPSAPRRRVERAARAGGAVGARTARVVVIGAGAAGLAAAAGLAPRAEVILVEARDRVGGRIDTRVDPVLGIAVEHGAEFVHGRPGRTLALARSAGARVVEVPDRHARRAGEGLTDAGEAFAEAQRLLAAGTRDDVPFSSVLHHARARVTPAAIALAGDFVRGFYLADPATASSLALARFTRALDDVEGDVTGRVEGGYLRVLRPLLRALRAARAEVRLSNEVEEIRWRPGRVEVLARGPTGHPLAHLEADRAVVTLPADLIREGTIRFVPPLPRKRDAARALETGAVVKVLLRLRRPLWAASGRSALSFLHVEGTPFPVFWTLAPLRAPVLVGWAGGPAAAALGARGPRHALREAVRSAARGLGVGRAALEDALDGASVVDWTRDPLARGGYAVFPVGSAGVQAELASPSHGTLFFAGEATAGGLAGTVEGALRSGERAAREVASSLRA